MIERGLYILILVLIVLLVLKALGVDIHLG